jgi:hypothetical protein
LDYQEQLLSLHRKLVADYVSGSQRLSDAVYVEFDEKWAEFTHGCDTITTSLFSGKASFNTAESDFEKVRARFELAVSEIVSLVQSKLLSSTQKQ